MALKLFIPISITLCLALLNECVTSDLAILKDKDQLRICFLPTHRQLVKSGVLTVRDAGSWWLSIPNSGKFTKYFIKGWC